MISDKRTNCRKFEKNLRVKRSVLNAELARSVRKFLIISQIFVCAPMGAHSAVAAQGLKHRLLQGLHIAWCLLLYGVIATSVYTEYTNSNVDLPTVQKPLFFSEYVVYLVHVLYIIIGSYWARREFHDFRGRVVDFDGCLLEFHVRPEYRRLSVFCSVHIWLIVVHFACTVVIDYFYSDRTLRGVVGSMVVYLLPNVILHMSLIQYYVLLYAIGLRAGRLNSVLHLHLSRFALDSGELLKSLSRLRSLYSRLELLTKEVNSSFGQSVVLVYIGSFMNISVNLFLIYKYLDNLECLDWAWTMYSIVWTCMHLGKMFLILYYNHCVEAQKSTTALVLNEMRGQNTALEETITRFIYQLIIDSRSHIVCGVAVLNLNFIKSLLLAISTLFIFLLQYDVTYEALTKTHSSGNPPKH